LAAVVGVAGLAFEARIASGRHTRAIGSGDGRTLAESVASAVAADCRGLISFGIAGGLAPGLGPGTCLVGSTIITETAAFATDWNWSRNLLGLIPGAIHGAIVGRSPPVVTHPDAKRALHLCTGALAVDNESHVVARIAADRGLPMAAVRVVLDPASHELPQIAVDAMRPEGTIDLAALMNGLLRDPSELPMLLRIAADAVLGFAALLRWRPLLGPGLGLPGLEAARRPAPSAAPGTDVPEPTICGFDQRSLEHT
jgi:hopanoid-associated phosphorylase